MSAGIDKQKTWSDVLEITKVSVSSAIFSTWINNTYLTQLKKVNNRYTAEVACTSSFVKSTVETRYYGLLQDTLMSVLGHPCDLTFSIKEMVSKEPDEENGTHSPLFSKKDDQEEVMNIIVQSRVRPNFTFKNFAVSASNQMAWAAAEAVAQRPGQVYNPLFLWGGVGVGKTHLMNAVGHYIISNGLSSKVLFCTGEDFTNDIVEGIRNKTTQAFRNKYRKLKALLIDDIQFIAGKDAVQVEFFHTFNAVSGAGGQIIMTSDQPPSAISKLEGRLRSRFEAGLIIDISPPDFELRCAIIQIKAKEKGIELDAPMIHLIAGNVDSARKVEGFLTRLMSEAKIKSLAVDEELIKSLLGKGGEPNGHMVKNATPSEVVDKVCNYYSVGKRAMMGKTRAKMIAQPRQILMYLLRTELGLPLQEVGRIVGGRDHTTVIHAVDKVTQLASEDVQIREDILGIKRII